MRVLFFILITVFSNLLSAQVAEQRCNTEDADSAIVVNFPWYGNNELLLSYVDSIEAPFSCTNCRVANYGLSTKKYQEPINVII
ncbi:MAG TPA: hypothetical protein VLZ75_09050 [Chitinophagales bacterium]|nr:hypothetical protein [Chitinophagales bacterium]